MKKRQERSKSGYLKGTPELDALADMMEREKEIRAESFSEFDLMPAA